MEDNEYSNINTNSTYQSDRLKKEINALIEKEQLYKPWSHYKKLKESNPKLYLDPNIQRQIERDSRALGNAFVDTDDFIND